MHAEQHPLATAFPGQQEQLQRLRRENPLLNRKAEEFEALNASILRVETGEQRVDDAMLGALRQERTALQDDIAAELKRAAGSCCGGCCG